MAATTTAAALQATVIRATATAASWREASPAAACLRPLRLHALVADARRKHGCSYGYGYAGCGYPGWPAYPVPGANWDEGGYNSFTDPNCFGCSKHHHLFSRCKRNHGCHHTQPYPWYAYPPVMPCMMETEPCCMDCAGDGDFVPDLFPSGTSN